MARSPPRSYPFPKDQISPTSFSSTAYMVQPSLDAVDQSGVGPSGMTNDYAFFYTIKFKLCFFSMCLNTVLFALDQFIIVVAVPDIVSEFGALDKVEWLNTAFFIPCAGFILWYTQIMTIVSPRYIYLASILTFEAGCAVCGAATSMNMLIIGRAVAGLGGAGMYNATWLIGGETIPSEKRPGYFGLLGVSFMISSVIGPLIGGAFTDMSAHGWRWCFYINLPIGGVTFLLLLLLLPATPKLLPFDGLPDTRPVWRRLISMDWIGIALTLGFITCFGMALQWGGVTKDWNSPSVIVTLVLCLVLFGALLAWSAILGDRAMIPLTLFRSRHFAAGCFVSFFAYGVVVLCLYYLPLWFEAIKDKSATRAGVLLLALQLTMGPFLIISGKVGEKTGIAKYTILLGSCLLAVGTGLFTMIKRDSSLGMTIGFQVVVGIGLGMILNIMVILMQAKYLREPRMIPHVTGVFNWVGFLGRVISMSTGTNIFNNKLRQGLNTVVGLDPAIKAEIAAAPNAVWTAVPVDIRPDVLRIYSNSIVKVFWLALALAIACLLCATCYDNIDLKDAAEQDKKSREAALQGPSYPMESGGMKGSADDLNGKSYID
ncbi:hypothetical protein CI109_105523 [Kwoniella shandongensis]|uniref:Major facilitator superfamily (MFS) profile domain-containing protein n=1 Tax=Kwoniella shandongensis TaxID=1734106 RepID=A0AAJ8MZG0_9TREE